MKIVPGAVSILIPCRNAERYLAATIESALAQTQPAFEVLVVDDGSTDGSAVVASGFGARVTVVASPGRGVSAARNHATHLARGEFIQYLDADDLLEPHALASRVDTLQRTGADIAISGWQRMVERDGTWGDGAVEEGRWPETTEPADLVVFKGFWAPAAALLYRRSLCDRIGGWRETLPVIQDARYLLDAVRVGGRVTHVPGVGARYRQHAGNSVSTSGAAAFWWDVLRNAREVEALWRADGCLDASHRAALAEAYALCARTGFTHDRELFEAGRAELNRFAEVALPRLLRAAGALTRLLGYARARAILAPYCR